jgi:hypothetical protein
MRTQASVRTISFSGPFALAAGLVTVACFSSPLWENFYLIQATALNTTMTVGAWGLCTNLINGTGVTGPTSWCTSNTVGYNYNFDLNETGINQFPTIQDDFILFGLNLTAGNYVPVLSGSSTRLFTSHIALAILTILTVISLLFPPYFFGTHGESTLYAIQKSGLITLFLGIISFVLGIVTFAIDLAVVLPAISKLNGIEGISAKVGNVPWFILPSLLVMLPAFASVLMTPTVNEFAAL